MEYKHINDYELVYYIRENDDDALELLIKKYTPVVSRICSKYFRKYKYIGIDYDDLMQEANISLVKAIKSYNDEDSMLYSYITLCVDRHLITYCRNYNSLKNYPINFSVGDEFLYNIKEDMNNDVIDILYNNDLFFRIKNFLSPKLSTIFELRYNDFSYKEISKLLDIPVSTVDGRICQIKKKIRNNFKFEV